MKKRSNKTAGLGLALSLAGAAAVFAGPAFLSGGEAAAREVAPASLKASVAAFEKGLRPATRAPGAAPTRWTIEERMAHHGVPGVSVAILQDGEVVWAKGYGVRKAGTSNPVDSQTVFSVGSLSKTGAGMTVLKLVADGVLDLDTDVNTYLKRWKVPESDLAKDTPLTLRGLLSHTAGLNVHGFADFNPGEDLPDVVQILNGSGPAKNDPVKIIHAPGTTYDYSGGGTTVAGLAAADAGGASFPDVARQRVFTPLGMARTTFVVPLPEDYGNIAYAHDDKGALTALPRGYHSFPETAASGLWTTPTEYATMLGALIASYHGKKGAFLPQALAIDALTPVSPSPHGLAPRIYGEAKARRMNHSGANDSYRALYDVDIETGDGAVIFTNGSNGGALHGEIMRAMSDAFGWNNFPEALGVALPADHLRRFTGKYRLRAPGDKVNGEPAADLPKEISIKIDDAALAARMKSPYGAQTTSLMAIDPMRFTTPSAGWTFDFVRDAYNGVVGFRLRSNDRVETFERVGD